MLMDSHPLFVAPAGVRTRWASPENPSAAPGSGGRVADGRKGRACVPIAPGESLTLAQIAGTSGTVRRIWITIRDRRPVMLRGMRIDIHWDGSDKPAVSAPLGDFFGQPLGRMVAFQSALFSSPEGRSFNCCLPMPFRSGMKIVVTNETDQRQPMFFYDVDFTVGDAHGEDALYLHAHWRRENPTTLLRDFEVLPHVTGRGRFLGAFYGAIADTERYLNTWWGEGELKVFLDGDAALPTLCGTGTEDLIGTGWGQGRYDHLHQGCHLADGERMQYGFYRLHLPDPIYFHRDIRATIQQIGWTGHDTLKQMRDKGESVMMHGKPLPDGTGGLFERQDDWCACAFFYLDRPANDLPALAPPAERTAGLYEPPNANRRMDA